MKTDHAPWKVNRLALREFQIHVYILLTFYNELRQFLTKCNLLVKEMVCVTPQATFQTSFDNNASTDLGTFSSPFSPCPSIPVVPSPHMYKSQASRHKQTKLTTNSNVYLSWLAQIFGSKIQDFFRLFSKTWIYFSRLKVIK